MPMIRPASSPVSIPGSVADADEISESEDGRRARRERNRFAVVDAMLGLYAEGTFEPSSDLIAERANLSPRSLFRYFDDIDDLVRAAIARQQQRLVPLADLAVDTNADFGERLDVLVAQRLRLFEAMGNVGVVSRLRAMTQPIIATQLTEARRVLRSQLLVLFGPELAVLGPVGARSVLAAADVICSFEGYRLLVDDQGMTPTTIAATWTQALTVLFTQELP